MKHTVSVYIWVSRCSQSMVCYECFVPRIARSYFPILNISSTNATIYCFFYAFKITYFLL